jgi:hypothetical protein
MCTTILAHDDSERRGLTQLWSKIKMSKIKKSKTKMRGEGEDA